MSGRRQRKGQRDPLAEEDERGATQAKRRRAQNASPSSSRPPAASAASLPGAPPPPPSAWAAAPTDLLGLLFDLFPLRPRLHVLSLVCKRWRAVALARPTALPSLPPAALKRALAVLPNVTALRDLPSDVGAPPSGLRSLHLPARSTVTMQQVTQLMWLTSLSLDLTAPGSLLNSLGPPGTLRPLTRLTSLALALPPGGSYRSLPWPLGCFPALTSLSIERDRPSEATMFRIAPPRHPTDALARLLSPYASSLTSLCVTEPALADAWPPVPLPQLTHLHWPKWLPHDAALPRLRTLGVSLRDFPRTREPPLAPLPVPLAELDLTDLERTATMRANEHLGSLMRPCLHTLGLPCVPGFALNVHPAVRALTLGSMDPSRNLVAHFPSLTSLTITQMYKAEKLAALFDGLADQALPLRALSVCVSAATLSEEELGTLHAGLCRLEECGVWYVAVKTEGNCEGLRKLAALLLWLDLEIISSSF